MKTSLKRETIEMLREVQMSYQEIGDVLGISRQRVHQIYKRYKPGKPNLERDTTKETQMFTMVEKPCVQCNKAFEGKLHSKFCSNTCRKEYYRLLSKKWRVEHPEVVRLANKKRREEREKFLLANPHIRIEERKRNTEKNRFKYQNDPEFRKRKNQLSMEGYKRTMKDPEKKKKLRAHQREYYQNRKNKGRITDNKQNNEKNT